MAEGELNNKKINKRLIKSMKVQPILWYLLLIPVWSSGQKFTHQVYVLSDHFEKEKCEVYAPCDCCASDLIFLTKRIFTLVDRCLYQDTYLKGRYAIKENIMTLRFKPVVVSNTYDEKNKLEGYEKKEVIMTPLMLQVNLCRDKITLGHPTIKEYQYGSRQGSEKEKEIIKELRKTKAWKML